ncbi:hypothetical protein QTP88_022238 [Uroleucon formosanum]
MEIIFSSGVNKTYAYYTKRYNLWSTMAYKRIIFIIIMIYLYDIMRHWIAVAFENRVPQSRSSSSGLVRSRGGECELSSLNLRSCWHRATVRHPILKYRRRSRKRRRN